MRLYSRKTKYAGAPYTCARFFQIPPNSMMPVMSEIETTSEFRISIFKNPPANSAPPRFVKFGPSCRSEIISHSVKATRTSGCPAAAACA